MPQLKRKIDVKKAESVELSKNDKNDLNFGDFNLEEVSSDEEEDVKEESDGENDPGPIFGGSESENEDSNSDDDEDGEEEDDDDDEEEEEEGSSSGEDDSGSETASIDNGEKTKEQRIDGGATSTETISTEGKKQNEYENDSSDEEDLRNTVGNIPMNWYDDYPHLGYNWDGKRILKPEKGDQLDDFLKRMEDPDFWRTVSDSQTGQKVVLSEADMELISRMQKNQVPNSTYDEYAPWVEWFTSKVMKTSLRNFPEHKRSFLPSASEKAKVSKLVHALKMGWIKPEAEKQKELEEKRKGPKFYNLWKSDEPEYMRRIHNHIPAPRRPLPGHAESYNPPAEYLFDNKEMKEWKKHEETPWKRKLHYVPKKYGSLREVPAYERFVQERFQRCLDLYLCPRGRKMRLAIEPEDLIPKLPSPKDLQPFPTAQSIVYTGHTDFVRTISVDAKGQYLVSGSDDMTVKVWEISTGRCLKTIPCGGIVRSVSWCPTQVITLLLVAADRKVLLINPGVGDILAVAKTDSLLEEPPVEEPMTDKITSAVQWDVPESTSEEYKNGIRIVINHFKEVAHVSWHGRGDYFSTTMPEGAHRAVIIHQLSRRRSQIPFSKSKGLVQRVVFHPIRPYLFVAFQRQIRVYDLVKQEIVKKLTSSVRWISSIAVHPSGDNVLVGTYDRKLLWYDLDLSTTPYQTLRLHSAAVRSVAFHPRYPLFASASDDKSVIVSHGMVYSDLLQNPLLVPLKRMSYHEVRDDIGVCDVVFHPTQPWLFSSGSDNTIRLYT